ncbi:MAG: 50S ribosomal protein L4 [Eubacteriales bacterium]|nr:50S ribosomal protein L4 [Eubacteriales bacterium]
MANVKVYDLSGKEVGNMDIADSIFGVKVNENLLHKAVTAQLTNKRQGTKKQKTRAEVRGGGRKPWKQKGTGHARQGSIRAVQWKGGGIAFAAVPKEYEVQLNKKERRLALKSALTNAVNNNQLIVIDEKKLDEIKTKKMQEALNNLKVESGIIVLNEYNENVIFSARNIEDIETKAVNELNVYDILKYKNMLVDKRAIKMIEEVYA